MKPALIAAVLAGFTTICFLGACTNSSPAADKTRVRGESGETSQAQVTTAPTFVFSATLSSTSSSPVIKPTATPVATGILRPALGTSPSDLYRAVVQTKAVRVFRFEIASALTLTSNGQTQVRPGITGNGAATLSDQELALTGIADAAGNSSTYTAMQVGGTTYLKGLAGVPGVDPNSWYIFPAELGNVTKDAPDAHSFLGLLDAEAFRRANFTTLRADDLDLLPCRVWQTQNNSFAQDLIDLLNNGQAARQTQAVDRTGYQLWVCADGYVHQLTAQLEGHDPAHPSDQGKLELELHLYDFDAPFQITPPPDAKVFQIPVAGTPNP